MQSRLDTLEQQRSTLQENVLPDQSTANHGHPLHDPNRSLTASGIQVTVNENLIQKAQELVNSLGEEVKSQVTVSDAIRLHLRFNDRTLKFTVGSLDQKVLLLRNKPQLRFIQQHKHVRVRSSKSRIERILETNARAVLRNLPHGRSLRVDASGRIKPRVQQQSTQEPIQIDRGQAQDAGL
ncbi:hypothetical protein DPMN_146805 [Dreissena polymorpha]|uniref:Uncharacterized protein n=1 Tax=Dreissena polymorpha TaxID=45954 RepID=A0A9D4F783_DREPO|nr:hypothetical protein DPMN_146805 [Dreissena polymorpha]